MKLVRYGNPGKEKPGLVDANGQLRDLSAVVKDNSQLRLASEVADAVDEELDVLLERRAGRERRLVAALLPKRHQTRRTQQSVRYRNLQAREPGH